MRNFLKGKGVLVVQDYLPSEPDRDVVKAYEEHGILGPDIATPRICLHQMFGQKWNKRLVEMLSAAFISMVNLGIYPTVQPN